MREDRLCRKSLPIRFIAAIAVVVFLLPLPSAAASTRKKTFDPVLLAKARAGDADAEFQVAAICARHGRNAKAHRWYLLAAQHGNIAAMAIVGDEFESGRSVHRDNKQALHWYRKAAEAGNLLAMIDLARMCENGLGARHDYAQAEEWYTKAAALGDPAAVIPLADHYETRLKNPAKAIEWYQKAAERGDAHSQYVLGLHFLHGKGVPQDTKKAAGYLSIAALHSDADAQFTLGQLYEQGDPAPANHPSKGSTKPVPDDKAPPGANPAPNSVDAIAKDPTQAVYWYSAAAEQGNIPAQARLSQMYESGQGVPKDEMEAVFWASVAAAESAGPHGGPPSEDLAKTRDSLAAQFPAPELVGVQTRVEIWLASHRANPKK